MSRKSILGIGIVVAVMLLSMVDPVAAVSAPDAGTTGSVVESVSAGTEYWCEYCCTITPC